MDANLLQARSYYYEFFAIPFFFYETDTKFKRWQQQLEFLRSSPIVPSDEAEFQNLAKFDFAAFKSEQNSFGWGVRTKFELSLSRLKISRL